MNRKELLTEINELHQRQRKMINLLVERTYSELVANRVCYDFTISGYVFDEARSRLNHSAGIYLFEADLSEIYKNWDRVYAGDMKRNKKREAWCQYLERIWGTVESSPQMYKKKVEFHYSYDEETNGFCKGYIPFYLGKSKNMFERIQTHHEGFYDREYGLRLKEHDNFYGVRFRVSCSDVSELDDVGMYHLTAEVEKELRERLKPIVGKQ